MITLRAISGSSTRTTVLGHVQRAGCHVATMHAVPSNGTSQNNCSKGAGPNRHCINNNMLPACTADAIGRGRRC